MEFIISRKKDKHNKLKFSIKYQVYVDYDCFIEYRTFKYNENDIKQDKYLVSDLYDFILYVVEFHNRLTGAEIKINDENKDKLVKDIITGMTTSIYKLKSIELSDFIN